jgi:hypothetical protein
MSSSYKKRKHKQTVPFTWQNLRLHKLILIIDIDDIEEISETMVFAQPSPPTSTKPANILRYPQNHNEFLPSYIA